MAKELAVTVEDSMRPLKIAIIFITASLWGACAFAQDTAPVLVPDQTVTVPDGTVVDPGDTPEECFDENGEVIDCPPSDEAIPPEPEADDAIPPEPLEEDVVPPEPEGDGNVIPAEPAVDGEVPQQP